MHAYSSAPESGISGAGLYVHVPFCSAICPYCDFAVVTGGRDKRARFVERLRAEIKLWEDCDWTFDTVYFGGGTPSALRSDELGSILDDLSQRLRLTPDCHFTLEVNPEDVDEPRVESWQELGFEMVSVGVQSFLAPELRFLGRRHDPERARASLECLRGRFSIVSLDLIFGLPGQTTESWRDNLGQAVQCEPDHISCYQLTIHEGTPFARQRDSGRLQELPDDSQGESYLLAHRELSVAGFEAYEVSNFSRSPAHRSPHNQKYWRHVPYLGLGPSAHSFDGRRRWWNERSQNQYEDRVARGARPITGEETLSDSELALEAVMLQLRTRDGIGYQSFADRYGIDLRETPHREVLGRWEQDGFAVRTPEGTHLTAAGLAIADAVARSLDI